MHVISGPFYLMSSAEKKRVLICVATVAVVRGKHGAKKIANEGYPMLCYM